MPISDIVLYINDKDLIYSDEQILIDSMNGISVSNTTTKYNYNTHDDYDQDEFNYSIVNQRFNLHDIIEQNNEIYVRIENEYSSYFLGKIIHGNPNNLSGKEYITIIGYQKIDNGYYIYIDV